MRPPPQRRGRSRHLPSKKHRDLRLPNKPKVLICNHLPGLCGYPHLQYPGDKLKTLGESGCGIASVILSLIPEFWVWAGN